MGNNKPIGRSWFFWSIAALIYFFQYGLLIFPTSIHQELTSSLRLSATDFGFLTSAFLLPYVVMQIPAGWLFDKFSVRSVLVFSALCMALGCYVFAVSLSFDALLLGRILMGFGGSFAFLGALAVGRSCFTAALFPLIVGLTEAMSGFGELGLSSVFAVLKQYQDWNFLVIEVGVLLIILGVLAFVFVRVKKPKTMHHQPVLEPLKIALHNPKIWLLSAYIGFSFTQFVVMTDLWGVPFLQIHYHMDTLKAVIDNDMVIVGFTLGCVFIGGLTRFIKPRRIVLIFTVAQFIFIMMASYLMTPWLVEGILLFILGIAMSAVVLCFDMAKRVVSASAYGVASGFINMFFNGIGMLVMPLVGYLFHLYDKNIFIAVIPVMICSFIAVILAVVIDRTKSYEKDISLL